MGTHPIFESDFDCLTDLVTRYSSIMSGHSSLDELNLRLSKMPFLSGYEAGEEDLSVISKMDAPSLQHPHIHRWFKQMTKGSESCCGGTTPPVVLKTNTSSPKPSSGHSKEVDFSILPKKEVQRDNKTGAMKEDPIYVEHRMKMFDELWEKQEAE